MNQIWCKKFCLAPPGLFPGRDTTFMVPFCGTMMAKRHNAPSLTLLMLLTLRFLVFVNRATAAGQHEEATPTYSHSIQRSAFFMPLRGILKRSSPWHILIRSDRSMNVSRSQRSLSVGLSRKTPIP